MRIFKASELPRVVACNGSPGLVDLAPKRAEDDREDAEEGTAFHHFAALLLQNGNNDPTRGPLVAVGDKAPNGYILDAEMFDHARDYAAMFFNEHLVNRVESAASWGTNAFLVKGKSDLAIWNASASVLAITDAKYGFRYVAPDNWQNVSYGIGIATTLKIAPKTFILGIYQPRIGGDPYRYVELTAAEMYAKYVELEAILSTPSDALQTGEHCRHCPAALGCPAHQRATYNAVDVALNSGQYAVKEAQYRNELDNLDRAAELIKQRKTLVEEAAKSALRDGRPVPGLATKPLLGNTAFRDDVTVGDLQVLGRSENVTFLDEVKVTPAEAKRRLTAAGRDPLIIDKLTHRPSRGFKLVKQDATELAAEAFGDAPPKRIRTARKKKAE